MAHASQRRSAEPITPGGWLSTAHPPERYDLVLLLFSDGKCRRGTWNGQVWWGYNEELRRSCALSPIGWRPFGG